MPYCLILADCLPQYNSHTFATPPDKREAKYVTLIANAVRLKYDVNFISLCSRAVMVDVSDAWPLYKLHTPSMGEGMQL